MCGFMSAHRHTCNVFLVAGSKTHLNPARTITNDGPGGQQSVFAAKKWGPHLIPRNGSYLSNAAAVHTNIAAMHVYTNISAVQVKIQIKFKTIYWCCVCVTGSQLPILTRIMVMWLSQRLSCSCNKCHVMVIWQSYDVRGSTLVLSFHYRKQLC